MKDGLLRPWLHPGVVEVVEAEQPNPTPPPDLKPTEKGGAEIAQVQRPAGGWGKTTPHPLLPQSEALGKLVLQAIGQVKRDHWRQKSGPSGRH
jgi:hypothetical protein